MIQTIFIFVGGGLGAISRYWLALGVYRVIGSRFPYGTLVVNILGCFIIGLWMTMFEDRFLVNPNLRLFLIIGILGGFTTFSSFSFETFALLQEGSYFLGIANILSSVFICLIGTWLGHILGKLI